MISVVIPAYNAAGHISKCLDSLQRQTYQDYELLIVDDGSTDNTRQIVGQRATEDRRIRLFHQENSGVSAARNRGIDEARGQWITFIDADDWVAEDYLSIYVEGNEGEQLCIQNMMMYAPDRAYSIDLRDESFDDRYRILHAPLLFGSACNALFSLEIVRNNGLKFDTRMSQGEDTDFIMRYSTYINKVRTSSKPTYHYILPPPDKAYNTRHMLYSATRLMQNAASSIPDNQQEQTRLMAAVADMSIDLAVEGLLTQPSPQTDAERSELRHLLHLFTICFVPHIRLSRRCSLRHRLFRIIFSNKWMQTHATDSLVWRVRNLVLTIDRLVHILKK